MADDAGNWVRGHFGYRDSSCTAENPDFKGRVERADGYLEISFLPGRTFCSPADFNTQLQVWLQRANTRIVRTITPVPSICSKRTIRE